MSSHITSIILLTTLALAAFVVYTRLFSPAHSDPSIPIPYTSKEGTRMLALASNDTQTALKNPGIALPPIDLAAPKKVETATFALG